MLDAGGREGGRRGMSYRNLEVWQMARMLSVEVHRMSVERLPKFEMYEEGAQIRRSMKSVRANIVEGYGRRRYKQEYIRFLTCALASCDETTDHLEILFETGSLTDAGLYTKLHDDLQVLGRKLNLFLQSIERGHQSVREDSAEYIIESDVPASSTQHPVSSIQHPLQT
jgi:four helix bundle protein